MNYESFAPASSGNGGRRGFGLNGPKVNPGNYVAKLTVKDKSYTQTFVVEDDPRLNIDIADRKAWTAKLMEIGEFSLKATEAMSDLAELQRHLSQLDRKKVKYDEAAAKEIRNVAGLYSELMSRVRGVYFGASGWIGQITGDQQAQFDYLQEMLIKLEPKKKAVLNDSVKKLNKSLSKENRYSGQ